MAKILFITPMWHEEVTPSDSKVCNFFVDEWIEQGHKLVIIHYRTRFPKLYQMLVSILPSSIRNFLCGDNTTVNFSNDEFSYNYKGAVVLSIPILKFIPHGTFGKSTLSKHVQFLLKELKELKFVPDAIVGHFCNPTIGIISGVKHEFVTVKTAVVLHENAITVKRILGKGTEKQLNDIDVIGYRSMSIQRSFEESYTLTNKRFICCSGVSTSFLRGSEPKRVWNDGPIKDFLFVGRLVFYKHPLAIVKALNTIFPTGNFCMSYIGKEDTASSIIREYVVKNGMDKSVSFLGQMSREDIINWYDRSDCFVMISDHEVFGLVYLEAMSRGCITIAGNNGGMEGIIKSGENGFLCAPGDEVELASIINTINRMSATEKAKISNNARKTAKEFSDNSVAENYLKNVL